MDTDTGLDAAATDAIESFMRREVLPYAPDAWYRADRVKVGYEISFSRHFHKPKPMRTLAEIHADIVAIDREAGDALSLLDSILPDTPAASPDPVRKPTGS